MCKSSDLFYEIERRIKDSSNSRRDIEDLHSIANEAYQIYFENMLEDGGESVRLLYCSEKELTRISKGDTFDIYAYPEDFYKINNTFRIVANNKECGDRELLVHIFKNGWDEALLKDPNWEASYEWCETIAKQSKEGLEIAKKDFEIKKVIIDYYQEPKPIAFPSCSSENEYTIKGVKYSQDIDPEICNQFSIRKIADIAAVIHSRDTLDINSYNTKINNIIQQKTFFN